MKKSVFRSLIIGLFTISAVNVSAEMNYQYLSDHFFNFTYNYGLPGFYISGEMMEANTDYYYEVDAFPNDDYDHTGDMVRVVWGPYFFQQGFFQGDNVYICHRDETGYYQDTQVWLGTNSIYETMIYVAPNGKFGIRVSTGQTAGVRYFGGGPILYWPEFWEYSEGEPVWNTVWGLN